MLIRREHFQQTQNLSSSLVLMQYWLFASWQHLKKSLFDTAFKHAWKVMRNFVYIRCCTSVWMTTLKETRFQRRCVNTAVQSLRGCWEEIGCIPRCVDTCEWAGSMCEVWCSPSLGIDMGGGGCWRYGAWRDLNGSDWCQRLEPHTNYTNCVKKKTADMRTHTPLNPLGYLCSCSLLACVCVCVLHRHRQTAKHTSRSSI